MLRVIHFAEEEQIGRDPFPDPVAYMDHGADGFLERVEEAKRNGEYLSPFVWIFSAKEW